MPSVRPLYQPRLAPIPRRDPQLGDQTNLTARRSDKVQAETQDRLVDDSVGPSGGVAVLRFEKGERAEGAVVDAVPAEGVDGGEEVGVVLLVGCDEDCGEGESKRA